MPKQPVELFDDLNKGSLTEYLVSRFSERYHYPRAKSKTTLSKSFIHFIKLTIKTMTKIQDFLRGWAVLQDAWDLLMIFSTIHTIQSLSRALTMVDLRFHTPESTYSEFRESQ